ncbi:MAG: Do family serine endopeptidase [Proteobacteria bacterium]|nr:Do family serine endopeptidase [Pseudomonadota bacterium]
MMIKRFKSIWTVFAFVVVVSNAPTIQARPDSFAPIVNSEKEKVVHISISSIVENPHITRDPFFERFFKNMPKKQRQSALGSGFIISQDGYIVTNHHVVAKADKIEVTLYNGTKYKAEVIGKDKLTELALIKIDAKNLPVVKWGDSSTMQVGDWVLAIGNPLGFEHTVTAGIISGRGRSVFGSTAYGQFLQTDAAINFGNSGGPLFNTDAEVIGINTAIAAGGQNLGFAIPSNLARNVIKQLRKGGKVERGWFGVEIHDVGNELAESFGLPKGIHGVVLTNVNQGSPAEKGGLQQGDVIVQYNGKPLEKATQLQQFVAETTPGTQVAVKIFRKGRFLTKTVKVALRGAEDAASPDSARNEYGMRLVELTPETRSGLDLKENHGLLVYDIDQTGIAWEKGLRRNDVILEANNRKLKRTDGFLEVLKNAKKSRRPISLLVVRNKRAMYMALPVR